MSNIFGYDTKFNSIKFPHLVHRFNNIPCPWEQDQIFIILFWLVQRSGKNLWKSARIFCKIAIKGCRNLQTLHSIPSYFFTLDILQSLSSRFLPSFHFYLIDPECSSRNAITISQQSAFCIFRHPLFFHSFFPPKVPSFFLLIDARRPLLNPLFPPFVLYSFLLFLPLAPYSSFFTSSFHSPQCSRFERFLQPSIFHIWSFLLFNTHTNFPDRRPGSPDISPTILGVHKGQVPPQQVSCLPAKVSREYRIRDEDQLIYLSRRGN